MTDPLDLDALEKTAPVQRYPKRIPWEVHLKAYEAYSKEYGSSQSPERMAERGGFGIGEMDFYYPKWREHVEELPKLRAELAALRAHLRQAVEVLKPFANAASILRDDEPDAYFMVDELWVEIDISAGQLRHAREALASITAALGDQPPAPIEPPRPEPEALAGEVR